LKRRTSILSQFVIGAMSLAAIAFTMQYMHPVFAGRAPGLSQLYTQADWRDSARENAPWSSSQQQPTLAVAPWIVLPGDSATRTPQFETDRAAFSADLMRTGQLEQARADSLASYAVREAYLRKLPPALVFGVMLVENARFESKANSNVGAVGLMQIYPKVWLRELGKRFGTNLSDDETNLRYGVYILSEYFDHASDDTTSDVVTSVRASLLHYNGCVRGTNTKNCKRYPDLVRDRIEQFALAQCTAGYDSCVARPLRQRLDAEATSATTPSTSAD
jgi:soluble lytic murein transglycosylase-like protein